MKNTQSICREKKNPLTASRAAKILYLVIIEKKNDKVEIFEQKKVQNLIFNLTV